MPLKTFPFMDWRVKKLYQTVLGIRSVSLVDLIDYNKARAKEEMQAALAATARPACRSSALAIAPST